MNRIFNLVGYVLLIATLPAALENMWEVYWCTFSAGPQMVGFVLAHADPSSTWVRIIRYSGFAGIAYHLFCIVVIGRILLGFLLSRHLKLFCWMFLIFTAHGIVSALYPYWSPWFERSVTVVP